MTEPLPRARVGRTGLEVTRLGLGTVALGFLYSATPEREAHATIRRALELGLNFFDTSPLYGNGTAETRVGAVLSTLPRGSFVLSTKAGYEIQEGASLDGFSHRFYLEAPRDFSYDAIMRSFERSLRRLRLERIDIVHIHDPDDRFEEALEGAYRALAKLRAGGVIRAVGAGMNQSAMLARFAGAADFDCFLVAGRYTLLDQAALEDLLPVCERKNISVFAGGVFNSGILADPYAAAPTFNYSPAAPAMVEKARRIDAVCRRHGVPLKAAAIQFPLGHPAVAAVLCGARSVAELEENERMFRRPIPAGLWAELKAEGLLPGQAPPGMEA